MQDYFGLSADRIAGLLDFSPANADAAALRQAVFDIWWSRDYSAWGRLKGRSYDLAQWPVADRMVLFLRKDTAARIWDLGSGDGSVFNPLAALPPNLCNENWQPLQAHTIIGVAGSRLGQLQGPIGLALDAEGRLAVSEEHNDRISLFSQTGELLGLYAAGDEEALLERPGGLRFGVDGNLYVADTWNYRVQVLDGEGRSLRTWGVPGLYGQNAPAEPSDALWGPRDLVQDADGLWYVADTGNKRIRVYTGAGQWLRDIGAGGSGPGELDEPSGLALHPDGRLFIADTWNRRIAVFNQDGSFLTQYPLSAWFGDRGNRPYLALDVLRDLLYVGDPDAGRVLVLDTAGNCLGSFGEPGGDDPAGSRIGTVAGLAVDEQGGVWLADSGSGRILGFPPFPLEPLSMDAYPPPQAP